MCVCVCVCVCARACVRVCVRARMRVCDIHTYSVHVLAVQTFQSLSSYATCELHVVVCAIHTYMYIHMGGESWCTTKAL